MPTCFAASSLRGPHMDSPASRCVVTWLHVRAIRGGGGGGTGGGSDIMLRSSSRGAPSSRWVVSKACDLRVLKAAVALDDELGRAIQMELY